MAKIHHTAICTSDVDASRRFWCEGLGLQPIMDMPFDGDWPTLFGASSTRLRSVFLGDPADLGAGIIELVEFEGAAPSEGPAVDTAPPGPPGRPGPPAAGFFLVSLTTDVDAALVRLAAIGFDGECREIEVAGVRLVVVTDPNGVLVELMDAQAASNLDAITRSD